MIEGSRLVELFNEYCDPERSDTHSKVERDRSYHSPEKRDRDEYASHESHSPPSPQIVLPLPQASVDDKDQLVLRLVRQRKAIRNNDVQQLLGLSRPAAGARLRKLVQRGDLVMHGTKAVAFYTEASHDPNEAR